MDVKNLKVFNNLSQEEIQKSLHCSKSEIVSYKKGSYIFQQDDEPQRMYIILSGQVMMIQVNASGKQTYAEYLGENDCFGEVDLFLEKKGYPYSVLAKTDVELLAIPEYFFTDVCSNQCIHHSQVTFNMLYVFAQAAERNAVRIHLLTYGSLRQRLAYYINQESQGTDFVKLTLKREELAIHLNAARPALSREFSFFQQQGIIRLDGRRDIYILDQEALEAEIDGVPHYTAKKA